MASPFMHFLKKYLMFEGVNSGAFGTGIFTLFNKICETAIFSRMANIKNEVLYRVYIVLAIVILVAIAIYVKVVKIAVFEGEKWRQKVADDYISIRTIEADRGNILAADGSLLATSLPYFDIGFDPNSTGMNPMDFTLNIDSLAHCLANFVDPSYTPGGYKDTLIALRAANVRFVPIKRNATFSQMQFISKFPLFNKGQYKGGFIATPKYRRERPFGMLANRTIGYVREDGNPIGLEGYFNETLAGEEGQQPMIRVEKDIWIPIDDLSKIEPQSGLDILTTIDVDVQDITEGALHRAMSLHEAEYGVAIVMEVQTGAVRAIANLGRTKDGTIWETYNHAVGSATEPGSTFKLASMMALLESGSVDLKDTVDLELGRAKFYDEEMVDATFHQLEKTTVRTAFEISSNVGMAKLVQEHFGGEGKAAEFIKYLKKFNLHHRTGIEIEGEAAPIIKEAYSEEDDWSGTTLPWMSIGYELTIAPIQLLTFYNAIANNGREMKPFLVSEVQEYGVTQRQFPATVISRQIASTATIKKVRSLLEGVVERGTAKKFNNAAYRFAGKTGTAQLNYSRTGTRTRVEGYQASFVGYFPADNPRYSCIVVIRNPKKGGIYGSDVALPVFREIADKIYATKEEFIDPINNMPRLALETNELPDMQIGDRRDMDYLLSTLHMPFIHQDDSPIAVVQATASDTVELNRRTITRDKVPNVVGMGLRDALYVLENMGLKVEVAGFGKVTRQSIIPGTFAKGQTIRLYLN